MTPIVHFWTLLWGKIHLMHGGIYGVLSPFLRREWCGGWVMGVLFIFGVISGYLLKSQILDEDAKVSDLIDEDTS